MINEVNFPNAYKEVYTILQYMDKEDTDLISPDYMNVIINKMNKDYEFVFNPELEIEDQITCRETKVILAYIFMNFWANDKQKEAINAKFKRDIQEEELKKQEKYNTNDLFKSKEKEDTKENTSVNTNYAMVEYKESIFKKILNIIKGFLKSKK